MRRVYGVVRVRRSQAGGGRTAPGSGVVVSTDQAACVTDETGRFSLPVDETDRFVKVSAPAGMRAGGPWFYDVRGLRDGRALDFTLAEEPRRARETFRFIQVSDLHILRGGPSKPDLVRADLERVVAAWHDRADFLVITGDLAGAGLADELIAARRAVDGLPLPTYWLPGSHDVETGAGADPFMDVFGPDSYSFDWGPVHFVCYNSISDGRDGAGRRWLHADLSLLPRGKPVVLFTHDPPDVAFFRALERYNVVAAVSGRWHSSRLYHDGRVAHFNTPSFGFGGIDYSPRGYRVFTWTDGALEAKTFALLPGDAGGRSAAAGWSFRPAADGICDQDNTGLRRGGLVPAEWPQHAGGPARVNRRPAQPVAGVEAVWRRALPGGLHLAAPVVHAGRLYVGLLHEDRQRGGQVACLDAASGVPLWTRVVGDSIKHTLAAGDGRVVGVTVTGEIFALAADTGAELWRVSLRDPSRRWVYSAPLLADGKVYAGTGGTFVALDAVTGTLLWERDDLSADDWMASCVSPAFDAETGAVVTGFFWQRTGLAALDAEDGSTRWEHRDVGPVSAVSTPAVEDGSLYVLRAQGALQKVDVRSGRVLWQLKSPDSWSPAAPVPAGDRVYVASGDGRVLAVLDDNGSVVWERQLPTALADVAAFRRRSAAALATPLLTGDVLWVPGADGVLYGLDAVEGSVRVKHRVGVPLLSAPVPAEDGLYVADASGCVHALKFAAAGRAAG